MTKDRHPGTEIGLAEVLQVCSVLGVREGTHAQWLAESLGLTWEKSVAGGKQTQSPTLPNAAASSATSAGDNSPNRPTRKLKLLEPVAQEPIAFEQVFEGQTDRIRRAAEIRPASLAESQARPPFQPLFRDQWFQAIFTAVLGVRMPSQEIDFRKLENAVVQGEFFAQLPFKTRTKLVKGVHVLIDRSESMQPFWRDQTELIARLRRMLGAALVQDSWFEYDPNAPGVIWHTAMPKQFRLETPVLIVTDFGSGLDPVSARTIDWQPWLPILELAHSSRSRIFALIASSQNYWPAAVSSFADCSLLWDRDTSPQMAARLCRR
jgi:hypothetical protein